MDTKLVDAITALEAVLGTETEIAFKLSFRVASLLAATDDDLPWWRVVNASGRLVPGHEAEQAELLVEEDVVVRAGRVRSAPIGRFHPTRAAAPTTRRQRS